MDILLIFLILIMLYCTVCACIFILMCCGAAIFGICAGIGVVVADVYNGAKKLIGRLLK